MSFVARCYVAGPMTGIPGFNYRAFDEARDVLAAEGWDVISPADLDRENLGIDFSTMEGTEDLSEFVHDFARQDLDALLDVHAVIVLDGWERSTGATNEVRIATMIGVPVFEFETRRLVEFDARFSNATSPSPLPPPSPPASGGIVHEADAWKLSEALRLVGIEPGTTSISEVRVVNEPTVDPSKPVSRRRTMLDEAANLVDGDRNVSYGDPSADFRRTANLWSTYLDGKTALDAHDVAAMMALLKLSRIRWSPEKRDSWVDLAGYAACGLDTIPEGWEK